MYFDNLTLAGLLATLPYIVMVFMFSRVQRTPAPRRAWVLESTERESYCYGT
jgi:hypothetical protein